MIFSSFFDEFPDLIETEVRHIELLDSPNDSESLIPQGHYIFFEYFCVDTNCECEKAIINIMSYDLSKSWAIVHYGWKSGKYMPEFQLDSHSANDAISNEFLDLFKEIIRRDRRYAARIRRHYVQFKTRMRELEITDILKNFLHNMASKKIGRNDPCHCNSGKKFKKCCFKQTVNEKLTKLITLRT